ncbi:unnamed protein product [Ixodes pacificus]
MLRKPVSPNKDERKEALVHVPLHCLSSCAKRKLGTRAMSYNPTQLSRSFEQKGSIECSKKKAHQTILRVPTFVQIEALSNLPIRDRLCPCFNFGTFCNVRKITGKYPNKFHERTNILMTS